jgi:ribulose-phosphate 3-epimerase
MIKISPSLLSADFANLGNEVNRLEEAGVDYLHIDVMDGHFVPNISFGTPIMKSLKKVTTVPFDVHLMITDPDKYIEDFVNSGANIITVHQESLYHLDRTIQYIKSFGVLAGVSINPATPVATINHILPLVDLVLVMSVNPGFGGQKFIPYTIDKIKELKEIKVNRGLNYIIEVDGGVNIENSLELEHAGADMLVSGSGIFSYEDYKIPVSKMKNNG